MDVLAQLFTRFSPGEIFQSLSSCFNGASNRIRTGVLALRGTTGALSKRVP